MGRGLRYRIAVPIIVGQMSLWGITRSYAQGQAEQTPQGPESPPAASAQPRTETTQDYNQRLQELLLAAGGPAGSLPDQDYRIGPDDLLDVSVFEAPDLNRTVRVSAEGDILLPLLGNVRAAGMTPPGLARVLEELLRRTYMKDPHVGIFLKEMQSHPVSVFGAVAKPGVYQIRGAKSLVEVLSMAQGLAPDAGDKVIVERQENERERPGDAFAGAPRANAPDQISGSPSMQGPAGPLAGNAVEIPLKELMSPGSMRHDVWVYPGDVVKVTHADLVYVVGAVHKPGGFTLKINQNISVLQLLALAEGLTPTSAKSRARIIRTDEATGARKEIPLDLKKILAGKTADPMLHAKDIVFVPSSTGKSVLYRGAETSVGIASGLIIYRW